MTKKIYSMPLMAITPLCSTGVICASPQPGFNDAMTIDDNGGNPMDGR